MYKKESTILLSELLGSYSDISDRMLASYMEASWLDYLLEQHRGVEKIQSLSPSLDVSKIICEYPIVVAEKVLNAVEEVQLEPQSFLEVGPGVGRFCFEFLSKIGSCEKIDLIEPATRFRQILTELFSPSSALNFPYLFVLDETRSFSFDTARLASFVRRS